MSRQINLLPDVPPMGKRMLAITDAVNSRSKPWLYRWSRCAECKRWRKYDEAECSCGSRALDLIDPDAIDDDPEAKP